jgi:4-hydroxy-tetrahydrodipicolinate synthase
MMIGVVREHAAGNIERANEIFHAYLPLARYEQQQGIGLAVRKYVLAKRGVIKSGALRKPRPNLTQLDIADVERLLAAQAKRLKEIGA